MRFFPAAAALSLAVAVTASVGYAEQQRVDPRAAALIAQGEAQLAAGQADAAIDAFETALAFDPGQPRVYVALADAARAQKLQGKAIRYYRAALAKDPRNLPAIAGEGAALAEKGAVDRARQSLTRLESLCGSNCAETQQLAQVIARGPQAKTLTAEAVLPEPVVTQN